MKLIPFLLSIFRLWYTLSFFNTVFCSYFGKIVLPYTHSMFALSLVRACLDRLVLA